MKTEVFAFVLLYKDSPNNRVHFGFYCIRIMVIFKHVFLLSLFWMRIRIPLWQPPVCISTGMPKNMASSRSWERGQFGGQHMGHSPRGAHSVQRHKDSDIETCNWIQYKKEYLSNNIYHSIIRVWWKVWRKEYTESTGLIFLCTC